MFTRTQEILGQQVFEQLQQVRVILFGVGGVGGWCAESLIRTGVQHLTLVDFDQIALSNLNRQLVATYDAIGLPKVEQMRQRLLSINPNADIQTICQRYDEDSASQYVFDHYDYVIDAIDTLDAKELLIHQATCSSATLFSSMGAGRKLDATRIRTTEFWKVSGCPLARALRNKMRKSGHMPQKKFQCV
jgi:tRNA A37 threonylcarbamoyladenosine dehydratase